MKTLKLFLLSFLIYINILKADTIPNNHFRYDDFIYKEGITTVMAHRDGWELSYPIIYLENTNDKIRFSFDKIGTTSGNYQYTIIHCDAEWQPSDLMFSEYAEGFEENELRDYKTSLNTLYDYLHYSFTIPNDDIKPIISGNYLLKIYQDYDIEDVVLTRRFCIVENKVKISANVRRATKVKYMYTHQEVDFEINTEKYSIDDPAENLKISILKNNCSNNAIYNLTPRYIEGDILKYDYEEENIFMAGNEFRHLDLKDKDFQSDRIKNIYYQAPYYHVLAYPDFPKAVNSYTLNPDLNGKFLVKRDRSDNNHIEADYFFVHFTLPMEAPVANGDVYVSGQLTDWRFYQKNKMEYNYEMHAYELSIPLKQGYYNYNYVVLSDTTNLIDDTLIDGSHYQTENDYVIYVYYRPMGENYDKLIGFKIANSIKKDK